MSKLKRTLRKTIVSAIVLSLFIFPAFVFTSNATAITANDLWAGANDDFSQANFKATTGMGDSDPRVIASSVIKVMLGFLGIIAVLIILYAGFLWMTAAGNEDKISQAKGMMSAGVIGLIIILAAFGIATFVMTALVTATGA